MSDSEDISWKKHEIYAKDEDSDYIEEEKEAKYLQEKKLKRFIDQGLVDENAFYDFNLTNKNNDLKENNNVLKLLEDSEDDEYNKKTNQYKISDDTKANLTNKSKEVNEYLKEIKEIIDPIIEDLEKNSKISQTPLALNYFKNKKKLYLAYISCLSFFIINKVSNKVSDYDPVVKKITSLKMAIDKLNDQGIYKYIDKLNNTIKSYETTIVNEDNSEEDKINNNDIQTINNKNNALSKKRKHKNCEVAKDNKEDNKLKVSKGFAEMEKKQKLAIEKSNKDLLKGRGMYRKRKDKQGNAKLMNRHKFEKKDKIRKRYVKEFVEAPLNVATAHGSGIRRDISRSTKLK